MLQCKAFSPAADLRIAAGHRLQRHCGAGRKIEDLKNWLFF